jgi:HK97 family phage major capsid protein
MNELELKAQLETLKTQLEAAATEKAKAEIALQIKSLEAKIPDTKKIEESVEGMKKSVDGIAQWQVKKDEADAANQKALDEVLAWKKESRNAMPTGKKSFGEAFSEAVETNFSEISQVKRGRPASIEIKAVGNMTTSSNLTGDPYQSYRPSLVALPPHQWNFRDVIPTVYSATGTYVHYKETGSEGSISRQTEGAAKTQIDFDFTEVKTANSYLAGYVRFAKQMITNLPWIQSELSRLLLREFFKKENSLFYTDVTTTSGIATSVGSETEDVKTLIDAVANQYNDGFQASYIMVNYLQQARLQKLLYTTGNYQGSGGALGTSNGVITIAGVPVIAAPWVADDKGLIIDRDYLQRIEVEGLKVEFFEQDSDNVQKNLITARIECMEALNLLLPQSVRFFDFGNAS